MKVLLFCVYLCSADISVAQVIEMCRPAQENKAYNFDFIVQPSLFDLSEFQIMKDDVVVSIGDTDLHFIDYFKSTVQTGVFRGIDRTLSVKLTIHNVTRRDQGTWSTSYLHNGRMHLSQELNCYLKTFVIPKTVSCKNYVHGGRLDIQCIALGIFPEGICVVRLSNNRGSIKQQTTTEYRHEMMLEGNDSYFRSACLLSIDLSTFTQKDLDIDITMYPNVTNTLEDSNYGAVKSLHYKLITLQKMLPHYTVDVEASIPRDCLELPINATHVLCAYGEIINTAPEEADVTVKQDLPLDNSVTDIITSTLISEGVIGSCEIHTDEDVFVTCTVKHKINQNVASQLMIQNGMVVEFLTAEETSTFLNSDSIADDQNIYQTYYIYRLPQDLLNSDLTTLTVSLTTAEDWKTFMKNITLVHKSEKTTYQSHDSINLITFSSIIIVLSCLIGCSVFVFCKTFRKLNDDKDTQLYDEIVDI
ncbi:uncharacterized protein LOC106061404 isoform X1 [Biomphalaria glabrata]|uniref:Uncharacterized protein LOC106061404 isoform X1 n=1 Tax=Biomphalaria glabrata TaxID=6526 RepID=A0A9U8E6S7_BIOGL|nr:uncharacterized protein LOC106061404 isoform X1 [Biomphalaria glabrata]